MMSTSHQLVAAGGWSVALAALHSRGALSANEAIFSAPIVLAMSLGPDIDIRLGSLVQDLLGGHRGWTHTLLALGVVTVFSYALFGAVTTATPGLSLGSPLLYTAAASWGWLSHMLADTCTRGGVPWLKPFTGKRYSWNLCLTGSWREWIIVALWLAACGLATVRLISVGSSIDKIRQNVHKIDA